MKMRDLVKNGLKVIVIVLYVLYRARYSLFGEVVNTPVDEMLKYNILGAMTGEETNMVLALDGIIFLIYFHLTFGRYISSYFEYMPSYFFSRITDKKKWFMKKLVELFFWTTVYIFLYLGSEVLVIVNLTSSPIDRKAAVIFLILWIICTIICFLSVIWINIFNIIWNKVIGFIVCYVGILFCLLLPSVTLDFKVQLFNPFSYMEILDKMDTWLYVKVGYLIVILIVSIFYGVKFIGKYDISLKEVD